MGEKLRRILPKVAASTLLLGSFTCRKFTTWDRRLYFPSEERRAEEFFARKIRRLRPGLNPRTPVPKANTNIVINVHKSSWMCLLFLSECDHTSAFWADFSRTSQYKISLKSVYQVSRCSMRNERQTDSHD